MNCPHCSVQQMCEACWIQLKAWAANKQLSSILSRARHRVSIPLRARTQPKRYFGAWSPDYESFEQWQHRRRRRDAQWSIRIWLLTMSVPNVLADTRRWYDYCLGLHLTAPFETPLTQRER